jgi:hypothetical protein
MSLTAQELRELQGLHYVISHVECFLSSSVSDLLLEGYLLSKATEAQVLKVCECCYRGNQ